MEMKSKPKFDPSKPFEVVSEPSGKSTKPKFDPSKEYTILSGDEVPPREASSEIAGLEGQKELADWTKKMAILGGHGASQGFSDEAIAGIKTGSLSSPEYVTERDILRDEMQKRKEEMGIPGVLAEAGGSVLSTLAVPVLRGSPVLKEIGSAALSGVGEAKEMEDVPREAGKAALIQGAAEGAGQVLKNTFFDDPTKILTRSLGVRSADIGGDVGAKAIQSTERLNKVGFFKQGDVSLPPRGHSFKRSSKNLTTFLKPLTKEDLAKRAVENIDILKSRNAELLKGKSIPNRDFRQTLVDGANELTYDPKGFGASQRYDLSQELINKVEDDLRRKAGWSGGQNGYLPAKDVELAKQSLDAYMKGPAFEKKILDLGIDKQGMMKFRTKLDELLDSPKVGGSEYKDNNDLMSDLITVSEVMKRKEAGSYVDSVGRSINTQNWWDKTKEALSPTFVDVARSDIAKLPETALGGFATKTLTRAPVERFTGRSPQSVQEGYNFGGVKPAFGNAFDKPMIDPREIVKYRLPTTTRGILEDKERVLAKLAQNKIPPEVIDTIAQALNEDQGSVADIAPLLMTQFPTLFEKSQYKVFDGKFVDPNEKAKAADAISKRDDLNSIQRAKMINQINKKGEMPQGL
jgi:hypothetical protein